MGAGALEWVPWVAAPMFAVCVVLATVMHRRKSNRDAPTEEMSTETVQFPTCTRVVLIALAVVFGGIAVWLCFASSPWAALPLVLAIALTLRVQMLAVVFGEEELIISGFFGHRHVPRSRVLRLEGGSQALSEGAWSREDVPDPSHVQCVELGGAFAERAAEA